MSEIKLSIDGTEYEFDEDWHPHSPNQSNFPIIIWEGKTIVGKAIPKESKPIQDWEIVEFRDQTNVRWTLNKQGKYETSVSDYTLDEMLNQGYSVKSGAVYIQSVRRISDNEVFSIGDRIQSLYFSKCRTIQSFEIEEGELQVNQEYGFCHLKDIQKVKPKVPLFTTEDGVEIFDKDEYYFVINWYFKQCFAYPNCLYADKAGIKYFSTEEKAKEYIWQNKPQLVSYRELKHFIDMQERPFSPLAIRIKDFFKSKINNT